MAGLRALAAVAAAVAATVILQTAAPWARDEIDVFLLVVVYYAVSGSRVQAILMGAFAGLMQDVFASQYLGFHAFVKIGVAYLIGGLGSRFMLSQSFPQFASLALATLLDGVLSAVLASLAGLPPQVHLGALSRQALFNGLAGMIVFTLVRRGLPRRGRR
jgi:rod shape-determining protein MreD